jgi:hypothetical protein
MHAPCIYVTWNESLLIFDVHVSALEHEASSPVIPNEVRKSKAKMRKGEMVMALHDVDNGEILTQHSSGSFVGLM